MPTLPTPTTLRAMCDEAELLAAGGAGRPAGVRRVLARAAPRSSAYSSSGLQRREQVLDRHDQRRVAGDPPLPVDHRRQLAEACVLSRVWALADRLGSPTRAAFDLVLDPGDRPARRPGARTRRRACASSANSAHGAPVGRRAGQHDLSPVLASKPLSRPGDRQAGREPFHVPLERAGQGLVEVVEVEDQARSGEANSAEVGQVGVAAQLDPQARASACVARSAAMGSAAPAVEGERRHQHPAVADRHQFGNPGRGLPEQQTDGVPGGIRVQAGVRVQGGAVPCRLSGCRALFPALAPGRPRRPG